MGYSDSIEAQLERYLNPVPTVNGWRPIETAPRNQLALFWICPRTLEDSPWCDSDGTPILSKHPPRIDLLTYGTWPALSKATHWMPLPSPPT